MTRKSGHTMAEEEGEAAAAAAAEASAQPAQADVGRQPSSALDALLDPLQELCPSLETLQALCQFQPVPFSSEQAAAHGEQHHRLQRISRAILRAASSGDMGLLNWICPLMSMPAGSLGAASSSSASPFTRSAVAPALAELTWAEIRDEDGAGPVNLAASSGYPEAVRLLVRHGADVNERDGSGWTPLMWAVNCANLPLVSFLLSHGADIEATTNKGATCEDFILAATPDAAASSLDSRRTSIASQTQDTRRTSQTSRTSTSSADAVSSDRSLIADLVFEHRQAVQKERDERESEALPPDFPASMSIGSSTDGSSFKSASIRQHSRASSTAVHRRLMGRAERTQLAEKQLRARELAEGRRRALLDVSVMLDLNYQDILGEEPRRSLGIRKPRRSASQSAQLAGLDKGCGALEVGADPLSSEFDFDHVCADQMLVFGEAQIQALVDHLVQAARPVRAPWVARSRPANVLFLCMRYACSLADEDLLEELVAAFVDAVETAIYAHPMQMTHLAFWLHNSVLLLHYTMRDATLRRFDTGKEFSNVIAELVNEVYMFIIRDTERRIDKVLDGAILDHEAIEGFGDVRYEDEWSFMRTLKGSVKSFGSAQSSPARNGTPERRRPLSQIFATDTTPVQSPQTSTSKVGSPHPFPTSASPSKSKNQFAKNAAPSPMSPSQSYLTEPSSDASAANLLAHPSPRTITSLLTSVLHVLQLYEINPAIIVQALSQVFYWVGCELFNRVLLQRRYLSKARAMQIRLSVSALEDWIKTNALPPAIVAHHFAAVHQLVSWVLCQSSLGDFDGLILTMQGLKKLNPAQLRRVVRDYRYEVNEPRMNAECVQYLDQLLHDWERRQALERGRREEEAIAAAAARERSKQAKVSAAAEQRSRHGRSGTATQDDPDGWMDEDDVRSEDGDVSMTPEDERAPLDSPLALGDESTATARASLKDDVDDDDDTTSAAVAKSSQRAIDSLFLPGRSMMDYVPPTLPPPPPSASLADMERLSSRDMLPFALPSTAADLVVSPGDAFGFGRGHFMGTGTPSLKNMRADSLMVEDATQALGPAFDSDAESVSASASASASPTKRQAGQALAGRHASELRAALAEAETETETKTEEARRKGGVDGSDGAAAVRMRASTLVEPFQAMSVSRPRHLPPPLSSSSSSSSASGASTSHSRASSSASLLFPQGKGLAAGAAWQPVPLLADGTLDVLAAVMRCGPGPGLGAA